MEGGVRLWKWGRVLIATLADADQKRRSSVSRNTENHRKEKRLTLTDFTIYNGIKSVTRTLNYAWTFFYAMLRERLIKE